MCLLVGKNWGKIYSGNLRHAFKAEENCFYILKTGMETGFTLYTNSSGNIPASRKLKSSIYTISFEIKQIAFLPMALLVLWYHCFIKYAYYWTNSRKRNKNKYAKERCSQSKKTYDSVVAFDVFVANNTFINHSIH